MTCSVAVGTLGSALGKALLSILDRLTVGATWH